MASFETEEAAGTPETRLKSNDNMSSTIRLNFMQIFLSNPVISLQRQDLLNQRAKVNSTAKALFQTSQFLSRNVSAPSRLTALLSLTRENEIDTAQFELVNYVYHSEIVKKQQQFSQVSETRKRRI